MNLQFLYYCFVTLVVANNLKEGTRSNSKWLDKVLKSLKQDSFLIKTHQILLIRSNTDQDQKDMIYHFQKNLPTIYLNATFAITMFKVMKNLKSFQNPRDTTLFIVTDSPKRQNCTLQLEKVMTLIKKLSTVRIRPKCLILRFLTVDHGSNYAEFLQKIWKDSFLDVTILDVLQKTEMNTRLNADVSYEKIVIHQLNPFNSYKEVGYRKQLFSGSTPLFPDKLKNLNGYPLNVGVIDRPPFVRVKRNATKYPVEVSGPNAFIGRVFSEMLNFTQAWVPSDDVVGHYRCNTNESTGLMFKIQHNQIKILSVTSTIGKGLCKRESIENAFFELDHFVAIIPVKEGLGFTVLVGSTLYYSIFLTVSIVITSFIVQTLLRFDNNTWNLAIVLQILFSSSVPQEPRKLQERIMFICFTIIAFYYSANIFASLTDFNFYPKEEVEVNSLNDLIKSGLKLGAERNAVSMIVQVFGKDNFTDWVRNNNHVINSETCIRNLLEHKNISCITKLSLADWQAGRYREKKLVKFVPEFILSAGSGFKLGPGSPYVEKFEKIYKLLVEAALIDKWKIQTIYQRHEKDDVLDGFLNSKISERRKIKYLMIGIITVGSCISILIFIIELLLGKLKVKRCRK